MKPQKITILDRWLTAMRTPGLYQQARNMYCDECGASIPGVWAWDAERNCYERADGGSDFHLRRIHKWEALKLALTVTPVVAASNSTGVNYHLFDPAATTSTLTVGQSAPVAADEGTEAVVDPQAETAASEPAKPASVVEEFDTIARRMREIREAEGRQAPA